ncbi:1-acyl-sn-glycerol-3-phosphate acyltransferases [Roseateles sp. YR242]|uniref:lysophospholipid acyltransferase family protein n=1 Tax=Roseateles sp. YR242 TaxID=1855305 RepID=UPI0008C0C98C|nr:lysophospholipid acyltransferase family protein [Roseateles sp. YR242]SEL71075.1 1-acyl-sn-glycerol-3-phosphate acyltransferases [Roseateles sp. YR242]
MSKRLSWPGRLWRVAATAIAFFTFGIGGLVLGIVVFPLLNLLVRSPERRGHWARGFIGTLFRLFIGWMRLLGLVTYELHGLERLRRQGLLVLANHPTLIDVVFLIGLVPNANCVVKSTLATHPCTRGPVRATGYICNNSGSDLLQNCVDALTAGGNLIIFPEGTRTRPGQTLTMQRGAAQIAVRAALDITPVHIHCEPLGLYKGQPWWRVAEQPLHFSIRVAEDMPTAPFLEATGGEASLAARRLTEHLVRYFSRNLNNQNLISGSHASAGERNQGVANLGTPAGGPES